MISGLIGEGVLWGASYGFVGPVGENRTAYVDRGRESQEKCGLQQGELLEVQTYYEGVQGCEAPWSERKLANGMLYDLASVSKVVGTTTRILQLIDTGKLGFDTPIQSLVPEFIHPQVTVGNLLLHNSGLCADLPGKYHMSKESLLDEIYHLPLESEPGSQVCYSDPGYILLGLVIQEADGCSLEESMQKGIFGPLGMKDTSYHPQASFDRFVPEERRKDRGMVCGEAHDSKAHLLGESGSAGIFSTLDDLMIFVQSYLAQDSRLFRKEMFQKLLETDVDGRGYGWNLEYGKGIFYHTGFTGTSILMDMEKKEGFVLLTNRIHPTRENTVYLEKRKELNHVWLDAKEA